MEVDDLRDLAKKLEEFASKRKVLLSECEEDVARRRDVMDMHAGEWERFRKDGDLTELQHPAATDFYCPDVRKLAKKAIRRNLVGKFKTVHWSAGGIKEDKVAAIHKHLAPYVVPKSFEAKGPSHQAFHKSNASSSDVNKPSPNAEPARLWPGLDTQQTRYENDEKFGSLVDGMVESAQKSLRRPRSIARPLLRYGRRKRPHTRRGSVWHPSSIVLTLPVLSMACVNFVPRNTPFQSTLGLVPSPTFRRAAATSSELHYHANHSS